MITFQANYLNSASIKRINTYKPSIKKVAFVEINPNNPSDVLALHKAAIKWDKTGGEGFAYDICEAVNKGKPDRFFALTTQHDRFDNLNFKQILSLAQVKTESKGEQYIEFLQVDPENSNKSEEPEFSHIGTAMLNCLKNNRIRLCKKCNFFLFKKRIYRCGSERRRGKAHVLGT